VKYRIVLRPDDNETLLVTCPDLPEVTSWGESIADAVRHAASAIEEALAARVAHGDPIPPPPSIVAGTVKPQSGESRAAA
jgi:antitoxin HicB